MYILDTDHLSILDRGGATAELLLQRLASVDRVEVAVSIISYEEQTRGWLSHIAKAKTVEQQVWRYKELRRQLNNYCRMTIVDFDAAAALESQRLRKLYPRLGPMDLKIAAVALVNQAVVLTRNRSDFGRIEGLSIEDWTIPDDRSPPHLSSQ
jgi:tRNA(fMet)-specific endonuclease VapC